jgi:UDP-N-acetylmuramate dehydrogenase
VTPRENEPLATRTTLAVGGPARWFVEARDEDTVLEADDWATSRGIPLRVLGGGSNLVVADEGVEALVVKVDLRGVSAHEVDGAIELTAAAGERWDDLVRRAVEHGWAGVECLSGIPGLVGATPIQNVGAYGQEVSDTVTEVRALDTREHRIVTLAGRDCGFAYRDSRFKSGEPGRWVVFSVSYRLRPGGPPTLRYADLEKHLEDRRLAAPTLADVRESVLAIRRAKSMVLDDTRDPNRRSCGSFFTNPIVTAAELAEIDRRVGDRTMPRWPQPDGRAKLSAAWLIERAGFTRGHRHGTVGLSTRHALAIVCHDGARARDVIDFAHHLQAAVADRCGARLALEPVVWDQASR